MPTVNVEPSADHPIPFTLGDDKVATFMDEMAVAGNTAELQVALGLTLELEPDEEERQRRLIEEMIRTKSTTALQAPNTAFAAAAFLRTYGQQLAFDVAQLRAAIANKLMEIANCGDPKYELKALELLGKHSDVGLFTDRSEVTITYKDPADLENAIKERVKRLLNATVVDTMAIGQASLDAELGEIFTPEPLEAPLVDAPMSEDQKDLSDALDD